VIESYDATGEVIQRSDDRYTGEYAQQWLTPASGDAERTQTLRASHGGATVAVLQSSGAATQVRYQITDEHNSVSLELAQDAVASSYEMFLPYGGSSLIAGPDEATVEPKVHRYTGKEADDSTGLYYYGARYQAQWLGRWLSPDPSGTADGLNLYAFTHGNPATYIDPDGRTTVWSSALAYGLGALATVIVGGGGALYLGHVRGRTSGTFMGTVAGTAGAIVAGSVIAATGREAVPMIMASVAASSLASAFSAYAGASSAEVAIHNARSLSIPWARAAVGTGASFWLGIGAGLLTAAIVPDASRVITAASGMTGAVLGSGAFWGFFGEEGWFARGNLWDISPRRVRDPRLIVPAVSRDRVGRRITLPANRLLLVIAPQYEAITRFESFVKKYNDPRAIFRLKPGEAFSDTNPTLHTVIAHGSHGHVLVSTGTNGSIVSPMPIEIFVGYVQRSLARFRDRVPIKFISCWGATRGFTEMPNGQLLANATKRIVYAYSGINNDEYEGPWQVFYPRQFQSLGTPRSRGPNNPLGPGYLSTYRQVTSQRVSRATQISRAARATHAARLRRAN
jgi:RHS repeat-associated protein